MNKNIEKFLNEYIKNQTLSMLLYKRRLGMRKDILCCKQSA